MYAVPSYARSSPSDQQQLIASYMYRRQNDIGKSAPSAKTFINSGRIRRSPSQVAYDDDDDEKDDETCLPRSGSSNSSLMYQNVTIPGTSTCTKSKSKDGESSTYSPSRRSKRNISPSQ